VAKVRQAGKGVTVERKGRGSGGRFRPRKRLGQHFLVDPMVRDDMLAHTGFGVDDTILEVGPGQGTLTLPLSQQVKGLIAVEKDRELIVPLEERLFEAGIDNVTLIHQDILKFDLRKIVSPSEKLHVIGNLPYNISTPFLQQLIQNRRYLGKAVLMFQLEVARRLTAVPSSKAYGAMSVMVQYAAACQPVMPVKRTSFYPKPKVDSMVVALDFERPYPKRAADEGFFRRVVKAAFAHRRKILLNSLKVLQPAMDRDRLMEGLRRCAIDPNRRAETLDMEDFLCLTSALAIDRPASP